MRSIKIIKIIVYLPCILTLIGCGGYWNTNRQHVASYAGTDTFGNTSKIYPLEVVMLGSGDPNSEASKVVLDMAAKIEQLPIRNKSLFYADCGIASMHANNLPYARKFLDQAIGTMSRITVGGKRELKARSLSGSEEEKLFKGEPHERSVSYLYRGILYLAEGDVENAQACFKSGTLQDVLAPEKSERCDWLSLDLLLLECKKLLHSSDLQEWISYIERRYEKDSLPSNWKKLRSNPVIVIVAVGKPPEKLAGKSKGEELHYKGEESLVNGVKVCAQSPQHLLYTSPVDDCYIQAVTRGRRKMDEVLTGKAKTRRGIEGVGSTAAFLGPLVGGPGAIALALTKEISWSISDSIDSYADIRQMRMLPGAIYLLLFERSEIKDQLCVEILGEAQRTLAKGCIPSNSITNRITVALVQFPY